MSTLSPRSQETYRYIALDAKGSRSTGTLEAPNRQAVCAELERRALTPIEVTQTKPRTRARGSKVSQAVLARAYTQLADLLRAGVPLLRSLRVLGKSKSSPASAKVFQEVAASVETGDELADSMARHPSVFRPIHVAMVRAGEKGGFLEPALVRLASFVQGQVELRNRVVGALIYPAAIMSIGAIILGVLFVFFVPKFKDKYADVELQLPTVIVMGISDLLVNRWPVVLVAIALAIGGLVYALRRDDLRAAMTSFFARLPVVGPLIRALAVARFARILGTLLESGVPMLASLRIAKDATGLPAMSGAIEDAADAVTNGDPLTEPLAESGLLGEDVVEMIGVAENANNLGAVLPTIASTLEGRVSRRLDVAVKLIEPVTILMIGSVIAFVALGLLMPMFKLASGQGIG